MSSQIGSPRPTQAATVTQQQQQQQQQRRVKAVFFDFMGTCLDWHSSVVRALPQAIPEPIRSAMALDWRQAFFEDIQFRSFQNMPQLDIDAAHRWALLRVLENETYKDHAHRFFRQGCAHANGDGGDFCCVNPAFEDAVRSWHSMSAWPDVLPALRALRETDPELELFVLANGTTRLQLDLARSSGLGEVFAMLFSSELLGVHKPAPDSYGKALGLVRAGPESAVMVAAHAYDTRAARALGFSTVYVHRWTDDRKEDMEAVRRENDCFLGEGGMRGLVGAIESLCRA
ncbi:hypothetical protein SLS62_001159 [Diatrype stigma]|uniref:Haloacid dehalogenase n=1 Tax=Diatrype stigma TaxID=117547 RepID=A0AAN9UYK0_9PEZI